jgi:hypothetical protein
LHILKPSERITGVEGKWHPERKHAQSEAAGLICPSQGAVLYDV